jgi:protein ImuA
MGLNSFWVSMVKGKADIIARLRRDLLPLQGFKPASDTDTNVGLGQVNHSFPNDSFPIGAMHEFISGKTEDSTASAGFIAAVLGKLMKNGGVSLWIGSSRTLFPPALKFFDVDPEKIIFIDLRQEKDVMWAMEEALKCDSLAAVVGEIQELNFTASRRFQLAVEQSRVTGFILRQNPRNLNITACVTRWKITHLPTIPADEMPGIGFSRWNY